MKRIRGGGLACLGLIFAGGWGSASIGRGAEAAPTQMEKFEVHAKHLLCFGIALTLWEDKYTHRVLAVYVKDVQPESMAELSGIRPGTRIWTIDGTPVENFEASFEPETELGKKFVNRRRGDDILLEIKVASERQTRLVTLTQNPLNVSFREPPPKKK